MDPLKIVLVGQTPPPFHGQAIAIERIVQARFQRVQVHHVRMDFSESMAEMGRVRFHKILRLFSLTRRTLRARRTAGARVLYYPPSGPSLVPVLRDIVFLLLVRSRFDALILDFHAAGLPEMESRLPPPLRPLFRKAFWGPTVALHRFPAPADAPRIPAQRDIVVPYGLEDVYPHYSNKARPPGFTILFVGIMTPAKGILTILESIRWLMDRDRRVRATFVGEFGRDFGPDDWDAAVERLGVSELVTHAGQLVGEAKWNAFAQAHAFCFPSSYENEALPLVLIEAMQFGLPVIASDWRGIPSMVSDGETGFLVPPGDAPAVGEKILQLAGDPDLQHRMGRSARERFLERYTLDVHLDAMEEAFLAASPEGIA